ncbi:DNA methyltransferase [Lactobacillus gasseri]|uniref:site-specific DNA-methyltransferase n=1 Tax=Lactobacillus gasseri TaxID=1596 RepID=UPI00336A5085
MQTDNEKYNETVQPNTAFLNELRNKLPEFFTKEGSFDLDKFKAELKNKNTSELSEGYQLDFIGKDYARRQAGEMPSTVIVPDEKQNQGEGKNSKNLFFTGDNLEVLRHLQNNYQNKIDVIYIDPPYNTGSDGFVYPDSFEYSDDQLKDMFGLDDDQVERLKSIQGKSSHASWLTFMYPRLALAKKLLSINGVIFISIDDNEDYNLQNMADELFGEGNFIAKIVVASNSSKNNSNYVSVTHEYVLAYAKDKNYVPDGWQVKKQQYDAYKAKANQLVKRNLSEAEIHNELLELVKFPRFYEFDHYTYADKKGIYQLDNPGGVTNGNTEFKLEHPVTHRFCAMPSGGWRYKTSKMKQLVAEEKIEFGKDETTVPRVKRYLDEYDSEKPRSVVFFDSQSSTKWLQRERLPFSFAKSDSLIKYIISMVPSTKNSIILDFFAGSSTTADAVMQLNAEDGGHRKFIMVQLPEKTYHTNKDGKEVPTKGGKAAYDAGFQSIDEISRERIRRAAKKIREDNKLTLPENFDGSFKHYRVVKPVKQTLEEIDDFDPNNTNLFTDMVDGFSSKSLGIDGDATGEETILTTWLAKDGYLFDADVEEVKFDNYTAHKVEDNRLYLIKEGWGAKQTKELLNQLGTHQLEVQSVVIFGYSFNVAELRELENGLKQLDSKVTLIKRY